MGKIRKSDLVIYKLPKTSAIQYFFSLWKEAQLTKPQPEKSNRQISIQYWIQTHKTHFCICIQYCMDICPLLFSERLMQKYSFHEKGTMKLSHSNLKGVPGNIFLYFIISKLSSTNVLKRVKYSISVTPY